jgi:Flp pilus assembly protein TadG
VEKMKKKITQDKSKNPFSALARYIRQTAGAIAPMFALMAPILVASIGGSIDVAHVYLMKQRLSHALDAAALAAAASETGQDNVEAKVQKFLDINYPAEKIGTVYDINVSVDGDIITADASAYFTTYFLHLIGIDQMHVDVRTGIERQVQGIEVVLVLDVTGSMSQEIDELEESVEMFVNRLCPKTNCPVNVKIGYVPFSTAVNVGPYGLGEDEYGNYYGPAFVNNPTGRDFNQGHWDQWHGCVLADFNNDTNADYTGNWEMYRNKRVYGTSNYYYNYESYSHYNGYNDRYYYYNHNSNCNLTYITPLTNNKTRLMNKVDFYASGNTLGNQGMIWGLRVLLPDFPFEEGAPWDDHVTKRVIVMMTDGQNTMPGGSSGYSAYGATNSHNIDKGDLDDKFAEICEHAKDDYGVSVYAITFSTGVDAYTEDLFKTCASSESHYYDVDEASDLAAAYDKIAKELANLHITE